MLTLLTSVLSVLIAQDPASNVQDVPATQVDEIIVNGVPVRPAAEAFVRTVGAPAPGRKAATWADGICVGVGGMAQEPAQYVVDRISDWAGSLGLSVGEAGCRPNIFVVATDDGDATARALVAARPRDFRTGVADSDPGSRSLEAFQSSGRPIRWWHVSLPVDADSGRPVRRLPGQMPLNIGETITRPSSLMGYGETVTASRIRDETRDDLMQVIIVLDSDALDQADFVQITDYMAMVALAQINPDAVPAGPSILRLFVPGEAHEPTMTRWDRAYLEALYTADQSYASQSANEETIALLMARRVAQGEAGADE